MTANATTHATSPSRTLRRQLHHVELQGIDASRIITSLAGRGGRAWPTTRTTTHA